MVDTTPTTAQTPTTAEAMKFAAAPAIETYGMPHNYGKGLSEIKFSSVFGLSTAAQSINLHKLLCTPACLMAMAYHENFTLVPCLYTALHGTYSICWLLHAVMFPPKNFEIALTPGQFVMNFVFVNLYWALPWYSAKTGVEGAIGVPQICAAVAIYTMGMFLHYVADAHKYYALKYRGKGLVTDGLYAYSRNPNYVGEVLIYIGFGLLQMSAVPWCINLFFWSTLFVMNAINKDKSLSRYEGWAEYKKQSGMFFPGF